MARSSAQLVVARPESEPERPASRAARAKAVPARGRRWLRRLLLLGLWLAAVGAVWLARAGLDRFLATHPGFALPPSARQADGRQLLIDGLRYAPRREVLAVFEPDFGRSVYQVPLQERRRQLMLIDWVRQATVRRRWPNQLLVSIEERRPVAFVLLPTDSGGPHRTALVDAEGVLLRLPPRGDFALPVLSGLSWQQPLAERRDRVAVMLRLLEQAGEYASRISEVDVSNPEDVVVVEALQGGAVRLRVGSENFAERLKKFHDYYPQIKGSATGPELYDLRPDGQIVQILAGADGPKATGPGSRNHAR